MNVLINGSKFDLYRKAPVEFFFTAEPLQFWNFSAEPLTKILEFLFIFFNFFREPHLRNFSLV